MRIPEHRTMLMNIPHMLSLPPARRARLQDWVRDEKLVHAVVIFSTHDSRRIVVEQFCVNRLGRHLFDPGSRNGKQTEFVVHEVQTPFPMDCALEVISDGS